MDTPSLESPRQRVFIPGSLTGLVAVIPGGGTGIGYATALGARVAIGSWTQAMGHRWEIP